MRKMAEDNGPNNIRQFPLDSEMVEFRKQLLAKMDRDDKPGTSFPRGIQPGDEIKIGNRRRRIKEIKSDTLLILEKDRANARFRNALIGFGILLAFGSLLCAAAFLIELL